MEAMNRHKAALVHLLFSALIAILLCLIVFMVWYPIPLNEATNVTHIFLLILIVDVVIGPLITLIIFNPQKKELKWDLTVIAVLQLSALAYGVFTVYSSRPVYLVFNIDRFDLVRANDLTLENINAANLNEFKRLPIWGPKLAFAVRPEDVDERQKILFSSLSGGDDLPFLPQYYEPYEQRKNEVKLRVSNIDQLPAYNKNSLAEIGALKEKYEKKGRTIVYVPLKGPHKDLSVILDSENGEVLQVVDFLPWK
jgi:hypothetical protein